MIAPGDGASRIKIVRVITRLNTGGPAVHAVLLTRGLNGGAFSSVLVTGVVGPSEGDMIDYAWERGVNPVIVPELRRDLSPWNDVRAFFKILRLLSASKPDIIHTHTAKAGGLGRLAGCVYNALRRLSGQRRARLIHTFHGHLFQGYFPRWKTALLLRAERTLGRMSDCIVTISEQLRHELASVFRVCPESRIAVIPLGLDFGWTARLDTLRGCLRREFDVPASSLTVGIVGRLTAIKKHEAFLQAARMCRVDDARFFVIGDGERRGELRELAEGLGLNDRVVFTGWQNDPAKVYADMDIVCLTSRNEGTPAALIEAMAAGVPVIATKVGGVKDLMVGDGAMDLRGFEIFSNGVLVSPDRPELVGVAVDFLGAHPGVRHAMGASGRSFVQRAFDVERLTAEMGQLYLDVLEGRRDHRRMR